VVGIGDVVVAPPVPCHSLSLARQSSPGRSRPLNVDLRLIQEEFSDVPLAKQ